MDIEKRRARVRRYDSKPENKAKRKLYMQNYSANYGKKNKNIISKRKKLYYLKNKELIDSKNKSYMLNHKAEFAAYRKVYDVNNKERLLSNSKKWYYAQDKEDYRKKKSIWESNKIKTDLNFAIKKRCRIRIINAFYKFSTTGKIMRAGKYGINYKGIIDKLIKTIPSDFNQRVYHIDHIIPCCSFDLTDPEQVKQCFAPENHRWLLAEDNLKKVSSDLKLRLVR
jgi:hypothetical protein